MGMPNDYVITSPDGVEVTIPHGSTNTLYRGVAVFGSGVTGYAKSKEGDKNYWGFIVDMAKMTIDTMKDKANSTQVLTDVPENAVFTDTETITSFQKVGNELKYTNEAGSVTTIDLSLYIDDTNLSRIINGNVDGQGIATFIREDSSSFAIDFSAFFDNTNITDADISNMGYTKVTHGTASDFVQAIM